MRVLVTGGSGFIGTNAIEVLLARGDEPISFDIVPPRVAEHGHYYHRVDLRDRETTIRKTREMRPDIVLHLGAHTNIDGRTVTVDYAANVEGVANMIEAVDSTDSIRHVVFASSRLIRPIGHEADESKEYNPPNAYGESKALGEIIVRRWGPRSAGWTIVRPTSVWGPWFSEPNLQFFRLIARGLYVHQGDLNPPKQYSYVENAVYQLLSILEAPREQVHGQVYYLADYVPLRLRDWAEDIAAALETRPVRTLPTPVLRAVARAGDVMAHVWRGTPLTSFRWRNMTAPVILDMAALQVVAPDLPVTAEEGVRRTVAWMRAQGLA